MVNSTEALKLALEALKRYGNRHRATYLLDGAWDAEITLGDKAFAAIKEALAQRTWVGLTDDEIDSCFEDHGWSPSEDYYPVIKDIEAKLKEKNGA